MTDHQTDVVSHPEIEHALTTPLELQQQFRQSIEQLTQAFQAYEGAADLGPSYMRHARRLLLDLSRNNINIIKYLENNYQNITHQLNINKQNADKHNAEYANYLLGMNQFQMQLQLIQVLVSLFLHNLQNQEKLRKDLEKQQQQLRSMQYQLEKTHPKPPPPKPVLDQLDNNARLARTMPFFPH